MISKINPFLLLKLTIIIFGCLLFTSTASAFTFSPKVIDLDLMQRDIVEKTVTLENPGGGTVRIYPTVHEISLDENGEVKAFEQAQGEERKEWVTSWIEVPRGRITLGPGDTKEVPVTFRINPQAKSGEYHAFISFQVARDKAEANQRALAGKGSGVIVRIALEKNRTEFLKLGGFSISRFVTDVTKDVLNFKIDNVGDAPLSPRGEVIFYDTSGNEVASMPINDRGVEVSAGGKETFISSIPEELGAGRYKAFLSLEYGVEQRASLNDTTFFYVMPLSTMLLIFGSVLAFALILTILVYRRMSGPVVESDTQSVSMYLRDGVSDSHDHDIDLKKKN